MTKGTSTKKLMKATAKIDGLHPVKVREKRRDVALLRLWGAMMTGRPMLLCVQTNSPGDHWVVAIGMLGTRYLVADSADLELVLSKEVGEIEAWWRDTEYEGVIL